MKALRVSFLGCGLLVVATITLLVKVSETSPLLAIVIGSILTIGLILGVRQYWILQQQVAHSIKLISGEADAKVDARDLKHWIEKNRLKSKLVVEHILQLGNVKEMAAVHESLLKDEVGIALQSVQVKIKDMKEEEDRQHWIAEGLAKFSEVLRKKDALGEYSASIISALVKYVGANQGGLFLEYQEEGERYLKLEGSYAYEKRKYQDHRVALGEGLLGQCMYEKDIVFITDVPKNYVHITSGLGLATPRNIVIVPLMVNEAFYGAIELASFEILRAHQIEFLKKVSVMIAAEIGAIKTLEHTKALLAESDEMSHKLKAQEEEMRMNMEELTSTQEEMRRHQVQLEKKQAELNSYLSAIDHTIASAEFSLKGDLINANKLFLTITGYEASHIRGKSYAQIFKDDESLHVMWDNLGLGKFFSGEFRMLDSNGKELWMNGTLNPILDANGKPEKIMLFSQFTTQEKEKINDLTSTVQALRQTLPLVEFNTDFQCKTANEKFMKMFGISRMELKNKKLCDFSRDEVFCDDLLKHQHTLLKDNQLNVTLAFQTTEGLETWCVTFSVVRDLSGNISRILMMLVSQDKGSMRLAM